MVNVLPILLCVLFPLPIQSLHLRSSRTHVKSSSQSPRSIQPCDNQGSEWKRRFPDLQHKFSAGCEDTKLKFATAKGGGSDSASATESPYGLGLGKTLSEAYKGGFDKGETMEELTTEDTQVGGAIFGASSGEPLSSNKEQLLEGNVARTDPVSLGESSDWNTELNINSKNAIIGPPTDSNAPSAPIASRFGGGVQMSDFTTNMGSGQVSFFGIFVSRVWGAIGVWGIRDFCLHCSYFFFFLCTVFW